MHVADKFTEHIAATQGASCIEVQRRQKLERCLKALAKLLC